MTQLTYNEAYDSRHAVFRFLRLHIACQILEPLAFDKLRIMDFYLLFPFKLQNMRLLDEDRSWRALSRSYVKKAPYGEVPDDNSIFVQMEPFQRAAATGLAQSKLISAELWDNNEIGFLDTSFPTALFERCTKLNGEMSEFMNALCKIMRHYPLVGRDGLKDRSGLLEYRYDSV